MIPAFPNDYMVIDSSAILAILLNEPEAAAFAQAIALDSTRLLSAVSALEAAIVIASKKGPLGEKELDLLLYKAKIDVVPFNNEMVQKARNAFSRFGKGRHPAGLNLGDCCSYALARQANEPLLFKGADFSQTDVQAAKLL